MSRFLSTDPDNLRRLAEWVKDTPADKAETIRVAEDLNRIADAIEAPALEPPDWRGF